MSVQGTSRIFTQQDAIDWFNQQIWYKNNEFKLHLGNNPNEQPVLLKPLKLDEYKPLYSRWNGVPIFKDKDNRLVQIMEHRFDLDGFKIGEHNANDVVPPFRSVHVVGSKLAPHVMQVPCDHGCVHKIESTVSSIFGNIKHHAAIAFGIPMSVDAKNGLPPKGVVAKMNVQAFFLDRGREGKLDHGVLTPLTYDQCSQIRGWDGLPVFKDQEGKVVRPSIVVNKETEEPGYASLEDEESDIYAIGVAPYEPGVAEVTLETNSDGPVDIKTIPLFNERLVEVGQNRAVVGTVSGLEPLEDEKKRPNSLSDEKKQLNFTPDEKKD